LLTVSRRAVYRRAGEPDGAVDADAAHSAGEPAPGMQPKLNMATETAGLFNLHPMVAINLHCIPTVVEMQPKLTNSTR